jgi:putative component of toxin-antitoxin plasmid stabilization module
VEAKVKTVAIYETEDGKRPFKQWLDSLRDKVAVARINPDLHVFSLGILVMQSQWVTA